MYSVSVIIRLLMLCICYINNEVALTMLYDCCNVVVCVYCVPLTNDEAMHDHISNLTVLSASVWCRVGGGYCVMMEITMIFSHEGCFDPCYHDSI